MLRSKALYLTHDDRSRLVKADFAHLSQLDISDVTLVAYNWTHHSGDILHHGKVQMVLPKKSFLLYCLSLLVVEHCFPGSSAGKEFACNARDPSSIPRLGIFPREGIGYPLQYSWVFLVAQTVKNLPAMKET